MTSSQKNSFRTSLGLLAVASALLAPALASAHCDTLDGPVVQTARAALEKGDVTPVLKWILAGDEAEIKAAFQRAVAVRGKGPEAKELADHYFFETLVRVHRAGEGAPYTGLKAAGAELGPAVEGADKALESGSISGVVKLVITDVSEGIEKRFRRTVELKKHANESVEKGRAFVASYVDYVHYVEGIHLSAAAGAGHHAEGAPEGHGEAHGH